MFLRRIRLNNYCQHEDLDERIDGNLVAVIGRNGTGKSNLLSSLQFAFTGMVPDTDKSDLLRDGASTGEVEIEFDNNGVLCSIRRRIDKPEAELAVGGTSSATGVTAVNEAIVELLGLDKDIARHAVFVRQAELDSIIFTEPAVRERSWQSMVGLGAAGKIYTKLGECATKIPQRRDYGPVIEEAKTELRTALDNYHKVAKLRDECAAKAKECPMPDAARISDLHALWNAAVERVKHTEELSTTGALVAEQKEVCNDLQQKLDALPDSQVISQQLQEAGAKLAELEAALKIAAKITSLKAQLAECQRKIDALTQEQAQYEAADYLMAQITKAEELIAKHKGSILSNETLRQALSAMPEPGKMTSCPVCSSPLKDPSEAISRLSAAVKDLSGEAGEMQAVVDELKTKWSARNTLDESLKIHQQDREVLAGKLAELSGQSAVVTEEDVATQAGVVVALRRQLDAWNEADKTLAVAKRELISLDVRRAEIQKKATAAVEKLDELETRLGIGAANAADELKTLTEAEAAYKAANDALSGAKAGLAGYRASARQLLQTLRKLKREDAAQDGLRELSATMESVRSWFHFSGGPRMVITDILDRLTPDINAMLAKFGSPYTVIPDYDNVLFRYVKGVGGGDPQPVSRLSGGERVMLAVSFRIASYCMFASKLGLLTLDEPTTYLDAQNVQLFVRLVERLRDITNAMGLQLLMSTHEESINPLCDTVINLNPPTK